VDSSVFDHTKPCAWNGPESIFRRARSGSNRYGLRRIGPEPFRCSPNALEWLRCIAAHTDDKTEKVMPAESTWKNRWQRWRQEEDAPLPLAWWVGKDDVLRHSYGTYRAAILRNSHNLAEEMGNSVTIVRTYHDAVVSPSLAKLWWKIRPAQ
jgi:hypothetical protein